MLKQLTFLLLLLSLALVLLGLGACVPTPSSPTAPGGVQIDQAVVRLPGGSLSGMGGDMSLAGYMRIKNNGPTDDTLTGIRADFAGGAMLHESSVDGNGVASMKMVMAIVIPAGQTVELKPGSFHVMFSDLKQEVKAGDAVTLVLQFKNAGAVSVQAQVINP